MARLLTAPWWLRSLLVRRACGAGDGRVCADPLDPGRPGPWAESDPTGPRRPRHPPLPRLPGVASPAWLAGRAMGRAHCCRALLSPVLLRVLRAPAMRSGTQRAPCVSVGPFGAEREGRLRCVLERAGSVGSMTAPWCTYAPSAARLQCFSARDALEPPGTSRRGPSGRGRRPWPFAVQPSALRAPAAVLLALARADESL